MNREIIPASTFIKYVESCHVQTRLKEILSLCWVTVVKSGCSIYGTLEPWDTGETWCYAIFCPSELYDEMSSYKNCLNEIGQRLNSINSNDLRPFGTTWIMSASDLQDSKHMLAREFLIACSKRCDIKN